MTAWSVDVLADIIAIITSSAQLVHIVGYHKSMCFSLGFGNWMTPIIYLIGSGVFPSIYGPNSETNTPSNNKKPTDPKEPSNSKDKASSSSEKQNSDAMEMTTIRQRKKRINSVAPVAPVIEI